MLCNAQATSLFYELHRSVRAAAAAVVTLVPARTVQVYQFALPDVSDA